jgi:hypothetical protein
MKQREYEITISSAGEVEIHVDGFKGKGCLEAVKFFEQVVGEAKDVRHTSGFYEPEEDVHQHTEQRF